MSAVLDETRRARGESVSRANAHPLDAWGFRARTLITGFTLLAAVAAFVLLWLSRSPYWAFWALAIIPVMLVCLLAASALTGRWDARYGCSLPSVLLARVAAPLRKPLVLSITPEVVGREWRAAAWHVVLGLLAAAWVVGSHLDVVSPILSDPDATWQSVLAAKPLLFAIVVAVLLAWYVLGLQKALARQLRVSDTEIELLSGSGKVLARSPFERVRFNGSTLLIGRRLFLVYSGIGRCALDEKQLVDYVLARLPPEAFVRHGTLEVTAFLRGNPKFWLWVGGSILAIVASIALPDA